MDAKSSSPGRLISAWLIEIVKIDWIMTDIKECTDPNKFKYY